MRAMTNATEVGDGDRAIRGEREARVVCDLPWVAVGVGEETCIATVESAAAGRVTVAPACFADMRTFSTSASERTLCAKTTPLKPPTCSSLMPAVERKLVATPEDQCEAARLKEHSLFDLLAAE